MTGHNDSRKRKVGITTSRRSPSEVWMQLRSLKKLKLMMTIQEVSGRQLATVAGYKSHAYMSRILRGEVDTLETEPAVRIAHFFGASIDDLFIVRVSNQTGSNDRSNAA